MFCTKRDASSEIVRYKARLIAKGYSQVARVDFNKTFVPVAKFITIICILIIIGTAMDWEIHQMNVKVVFLNEILKDGDLYGLTKAFCTKGEQILCMQTQLCIGPSNH